jgi:mono/diheme cytochrome c family protein
MRFAIPTEIVAWGTAAALAAGTWLAPAPAAAEEVPAAAVEEAKGIYSMRCATCHGASGHGDGAAAIAMDPKPKSFGDAEWQKTVTDEHIEKIIVGGGPAVGLSPLMPPNPDLAGKADVVKALRQMVRGFSD